MNSINLYKGATILAAGLGTSYVTKYIGNKAAKYFKVDTKAYTNTIIKTASVIAGLAAAALTARHLGVISFNNLSFQSKTPEAPVNPTLAETPVATPNKEVLKEVASYYTPEAHIENPDYLKQMGEQDQYIAEMAKNFLDKKNNSN